MFIYFLGGFWGFINTRSFFPSVYSDLPESPHLNICLLTLIPYSRGLLGNSHPRSTRILWITQRWVPFGIRRSLPDAGPESASGACMASTAKAWNATPSCHCVSTATLPQPWSHSDTDMLQAPSQILPPTAIRERLPLTSSMCTLSP